MAVQNKRAAHAGRLFRETYAFGACAYRFILISVSSISSETVMIFEFDWKPRCVMIISEN